MLERRADVGDDRRRQPLLPRRVVERLGIVAQVLVVEETLDRRCPEQRPEVHLRRPLADHRHDVVGIRRGGRQAGVLESIHAGNEAAADLVRPMRMGDDRLVMPMRLVDHRVDLLHRHLVLVDQLDDVDAGVGDLLHLGAPVVWSRDAPAVGLCVRVGLVLDEGTGDEERGAGNSSAVDAVAHVDARLERPAEIPRAGHAGHEQLLCRGGHDHRFELGEVGLVPMRVVGVADDHGVDVHVPEPGEHGHAFGRDDLRARRHGERADLADGGDGLPLDEDDAVPDRRAGKSVDEGAADEGFDFRGWSRGLGAEAGDEGGGDQDGESCHRREITPSGESSGHRSSVVGRRSSVVGAHKKSPLLFQAAGCAK